MMKNLKVGDELVVVWGFIYSTEVFKLLKKAPHSVKVVDDVLKVIAINKKVKYQSEDSRTEYKLVDLESIGSPIAHGIIEHAVKIITWNTVEDIREAKETIEELQRESLDDVKSQLRDTLNYLEGL